VPFEWLRMLHLAAIVGAIFGADAWLAHEGWNPSAPATLAVKVGLLAALPLLLVLTRFFRPGEWQAMRRLLPSR
jgi:hypothetical protein